MTAATIDPRSNGFNYGAPVREPALLFYHYCKAVADIVRHRNSSKAREKSWDLDIAIKNVRTSCSIEEQRHRLQQLRDFVRSDFAPKVTIKQYRKALAVANAALEQLGETYHWAAN